jgi:hypothetical protein
MPRGFVGLIWIIVSALIGAVVATAIWFATPDRWTLGVYNGRDITAAWRLNTRTGYLEGCTGIGDKPHCIAMPEPALSVGK